jgi:hypothetical protein
MNTKLHRRIKIVSIICLVISLGLIVVSLVLEKYDWLGIENTVSGLFLFALVTNYFIKKRETIVGKRLRVFNLITWASFGMAVILMLSLAFLGEKWQIPAAIGTVFASVFLIMIVIQLFVFNPSSLKGTIIALVLILVGIYFKRMHFPGSGVILTIFCAIMAYGAFVTGIACLYWLEKNRFLRNVTFIGGTILAFSFLGLVF